MTVKEFARRMGRSTSTIYRYIRDGLVKAVKVGRRWKVTEEIEMPQWNPQVHTRTALKDGLTPDDFRFLQFPTTNARIEHVQPEQHMPDDVVLRYRCDIPAETPLCNQYDKEGNKIPDPVGITLARVKFQLLDAYTREVLDEDLREHVDGEVWGNLAGDCHLWNVLKPGNFITVRLVAFPLFFYLDADGGARMDYANPGNQGHFKGKECVSHTYQLEMTKDGAILIDGKARPKAPEPDPDPSIAEYEALVAKEEKERLRIEQELQDRLAREKKEREEQWAREDAERERERQAQEREQEAARKRHAAEMEAEKKRAAEERARLGIQEDGDSVMAAMDNPPFEDSICLALQNLWSGQYAPHDTDGFKARLKEIRRNANFEAGVDEVCKRLGWTL